MDLNELRGLKICVVTGRPELRKLIYKDSVRKPDGYMDKPVDESELVLNVKKILEVTH